MNDIIHELAEGPKAKKTRRRLSRLVPTSVKRPKKQGTMIERGVAAYLNAMANISSMENSRPNRAYSLIATDPTVPVGIGGTLTASFTLPTDAYLVYWVVSDLDVANFVCTSLKVAGYDVVGGSPINLAALRSDVNRMDRPGPLTGRMFDGGTTIELSVRNVSGAATVFRGITVWMISTDCQTTKKGKPAPSVLSFRSIAGGFRNLFARRPALAA